MKTLKQYSKCVGCASEIYECYEYQQMGFDAGLEFGEEHLSFFAIDKDGKFIVPIFWRGKTDETKESLQDTLLEGITIIKFEEVEDENI